MNIYFILNALIIILLLFVLYIARYFLPNYFKRKAENLAQLQDVKELTTKIKEIEFKFEERTQTLKSQLDFSNNILIGLHNEERQSLIKIHNELHTYYNFITDMSFEGKHLNDNITIDEIINTRSLMFDKLFVQNSNVSIFLDDEEVHLNENISYCIEVLLSFSDDFLSHLHNIQKLNLKFRPKQNTDWEEMKNYYKEIEKLKHKHKKDISSLIDKVGPLLSETTLLIKRYLIKKSKRPIVC